MNIRKTLEKILESYGIYLKEGEDDLTNYILDSLQFISFIVDIESTLNIDIPDYLLKYDTLKSFNQFVSRLEEIYEEKGGELK